MKKRIFVALALVALVTGGGVFSQEKTWYNSYAPEIEGSKIFVNAGIGFGLLPYKMSLPPISASVEYGLDNIPLSLGGYFGIAGYNEDIGRANYSATMAGIAARAAWHFNFIRNLDTYVGLNLGFMLYKQTVETQGDTYYGTTVAGSKVENDLNTFYYAFNIGGRYFFTKNIGAYIELGYSPIAIASLGLSLKF
jgi:hypothetical protein